MSLKACSFPSEVPGLQVTYKLWYNEGDVHCDQAIVDVSEGEGSSAIVGPCPPPPPHASETLTVDPRQSPPAPLFRRLQEGKKKPPITRGPCGD